MHLDSSEIPSTTAAEPRRWDLQMPIPVDWRVKRAPHYNLVEQFDRMVSKCLIMFRAEKPQHSYPFLLSNASSFHFMLTS